MQETFEDAEMVALKAAKGHKTWRQFILDSIDYSAEVFIFIYTYILQYINCNMESK